MLSGCSNPSGFMEPLIMCTVLCFSDSEVTAMNPEPSDLMDKLDLSTSSIDMTNTSLAMQEEKESEISGVGE